MSQIVIGKSGNHKVALNLDALLRGRMLVQANSGKGKSWLLRRLAEQLFGKVQVIIIDPEGEFATLREKFGYVLVGNTAAVRAGRAETPADPRSAALVAHKLLELRASAVCDLYEMKPSARHEWVQRFLDAMIDAPKNLWHPCVVMVDEAHVYCPEKGAGESIASEAMIGLGTRGRKRGFCIVAATQRLGKLRKDLAAELLNVMIGGTFIDVDRKRAADALGVYGADQHKFFDAIKVLERGKFYALGPAIAQERILVDVGPVETSHPEAGSAKHAAEAPPAPESIAKMLPKLSDLPKAAEEKAKTEAELRAEIRSLKAQIRSAPVQKAQPTSAKVIVDSRLIKQAVDRALAESKRHYEKQIHTLIRLADDQFKVLQSCARSAAKVAQQAIPHLTTYDYKHLIPELQKVSGGEIQKGAVSSFSSVRPERDTTTMAHPRPDAISLAESNGDLKPAQIKILRAIAEFEAIGRSQISKSWIAARSGASYTSSAYTNNLGYLRSHTYITYPIKDQAALTDKGREAAGPIEPPQTSEEMLESCLKLLTPAQQRILKPLYERHPESVDKNELAELAGASATSSAYTNNLGSMKSAGMIEYPDRGHAKCADWLFLD